MGARLARTRRCRGGRLGAAREAKPMHLADHCIASDAAELGSDLTCRQTVGPQLLQHLDAFVSPAHEKLLGVRRGGKLRTESTPGSGQRLADPDAYSCYR